MYHRIGRNLYLLFLYFRTCMAAATASKRIFLMSTPWHGNLGDQAIILAEYQVLEKTFPDYTIIEYPTEMIRKLMMRFAWKPAMHGNDIIAMHGGGNLGSLYPEEEEVHRWVVENYPMQTIFFMPQSIFFAEDKQGQIELEKSRAVYCNANDLTIMERDHVSHQYGQEKFPFVKHFLAPDTVTALSAEKYLISAERHGVCFFLRRDKEKVLADDFVDQLVEWLVQYEIPYHRSDTVIMKSLRNRRSRWKAVAEKLNLARAARVVVTDRYHGVIFSVITHTPVIVFKSYDTKISAGIRWFQDLDWVHYAEAMDLMDIQRLIEYYCADEEIPVTIHSRCGALVMQAVSEVLQKTP